MKGNLTTLFSIRAFMHWCNQPLDMRMLGKNLVALFFLLAFVLQTFDRPFLLADYYANTANYEAHCENKAKPEIHCHGKCQVMKKLVAEEKKDQQNPERRSENRSELICENLFVEEIQQPSFELASIAYAAPANNGVLTHQNFDFFHPPRA